MKSRLGVMVFVISTLFAPSMFAAENPPPPPTSALDKGKIFGEVMTKFKELAGKPFAVGSCDKKDNEFVTSIVLYQLNESELFEIENSMKKFFYIRVKGNPSVFFQEDAGTFKEIPLPQIPTVLRGAGASEFLKSIDPSQPERGDCIARRVE